MNDIDIENTTAPALSNDAIDALMAKLHAADNNASDGEDAQPEGTSAEGAFIAEDSTSTQLN